MHIKILYLKFVFLNKIKKMNIRFILLKFEKNIVFQVLDMNERFRTDLRSEMAKVFICMNGLNIISEYSPSLNMKSIYLRGENIEEDFRTTVLSFLNNKSRDEYFNKILEALREWSENCTEIKEKKYKTGHRINDNEVTIYNL